MLFCVILLLFAMLESRQVDPELARGMPNGGILSVLEDGVKIWLSCLFVSVLKNLLYEIIAARILTSTGFEI